MKVMTAIGFLMSVFHQPLSEIKTLSLNELYFWARLAAGSVGKTFE